MHEDHPPSSDNSTWLERLGKSLLGEPLDKDQLIKTLRNAERQNLFDIDALTMIEGALQVADLTVRNVMIPRPQMDIVSDQDSLEEIVRRITDSGHSRFPVFSDKKDQFVGIVLAKDFLRYLSPQAAAHFELDDVLRPAVFIPENKRLNVLLNEFRDKRNHLALVMDEYSVVTGLVTIEDVIEQIVGEIDDEHDVDDVENAILANAEDRFTIKALTSVEEFNDYFGAGFDDSELDTIGGLITKQLGHLPKVGETVSLDNFHFTVLTADSRRIHLLEMTLDQPATA
ncbi:MAG TPA: CBS domain-containing protein [Gammaproteobacteria bacterium]|nr:CBS domain-containing protein [Gammaproteobacteria bacterium]